MKKNNLKRIRKYIFLEHTADIKFQAFGKNLNRAFENSALAMFNAMTNEKIKAEKKKTIKIKGRDKENLLYNFLEELLFLLDTENFFLGKIKVKIDTEKLELKAEIFGDNVKKYKPHIDIKAVTYNQMFVRNEKGRWVCQVVLDV